MLKFMVGAVCF